METTVIGRVERALRDFRPRNQREFVLLQIAKRFGDEDILAKYLNEGRDHPKKVLLEAARLAMRRSEAEGRPAPVIFFELLGKFRKEEPT